MKRVYAVAFYLLAFTSLFSCGKNQPEDAKMPEETKVPQGTSDFDVDSDLFEPCFFDGDENIFFDFTDDADFVDTFPEERNMLRSMGYTTTDFRFGNDILEKTLARFPDFTSFLDLDKSFALPGLINTYISSECSSMTPQGICTAENYILISAYDSLYESNSVIYVLSGENEHRLITVIELPKKLHAGGICFDGSAVWLCGASEYNGADNTRHGVVYRIDYRHLQHALSRNDSFFFLENDALEKHYTENAASFCTFFGERLWVGTFVMNSASRQSYGGLVSYSTEPADFISGIPLLGADSRIAIPNRAQGAAFAEINGKISLLISRSYSRGALANPMHYISEIRVYFPDFNNGRLISKNPAVFVLKTPPMIEEIIFSSEADRLFAVFESAATKYCSSKIPQARCSYIFDRVASIRLSEAIGTFNDYFLRGKRNEKVFRGSCGAFDDFCRFMRK